MVHIHQVYKAYINANSIPIIINAICMVANPTNATAHHQPIFKNNLFENICVILYFV